MDIKQTTIAAVIALIISVVVVTFSGGKPGPQGKDGADGKTFGALAGPDIPSHYLQWGGVYEYNAGAAITATSSYPCTFTNTAAAGLSGATSTILAAAMRVDSNSMGAAATLDISTTTHAAGFGSSSPMLVRAAAIGTGQSAIVWQPVATTSSLVLSDQNLTGESPYILKPGESLSFRIATSSPSAMSSYLTGTCTVRLQVI